MMLPLGSLFLICWIHLIDDCQGFLTNVMPGMYSKDSSVVQPLVSLCNSKGFTVQSGIKLNLCLTVNPATEKGVGKSYLCSDLAYTSIGSNRYKITEGNDQCMLKLRSHAHSLGIHLESPIQFTYSIEPTTEKGAALKATAGVHLKWSQQLTPVNALKAYGDKSALGFSVPSLISTLLLLFL